MFCTSFFSFFFFLCLFLSLFFFSISSCLHLLICHFIYLFLTLFLSLFLTISLFINLFIISFYFLQNGYLSISKDCIQFWNFWNQHSISPIYLQDLFAPASMAKVMKSEKVKWILLAVFLFCC